jgi:hypothetical protein
MKLLATFVTWKSTSRWRFEICTWHCLAGSEMRVEGMGKSSSAVTAVHSETGQKLK